MFKSQILQQEREIKLNSPAEATGLYLVNYRASMPYTLKAKVWH